MAVTLTAGLVWYLDAGRIYDRIVSVEAWSVAAASLVLATQYSLAALRWHYVLRRHGVGLPARQIQAIFGAGSLANIVALTAVAGMSVRAVLLLGRQVSASRAAGVLLVERSAAMAGFGLCILAGAAVLPLLPHGLDGLDFPARSALVALPAAVFAGVLAWALRGRIADMRFVAEIRSSFLMPSVVAGLAGVSCAIIWLGFAAVAILAHGMGLEVSAVFFFAVMPVVALLAALPVSIGGWGVREGAMVAGLLLFGVPADDGAALSITYGALGTVLTALLGGAGALLLRGQGREEKPPGS